MTYLITGSTGLVASRIAKMLIQADETVLGYEINPDFDMLNMNFSKKEIDKLNIVKGDILDFELLMQTLKENTVDTIIHFAAILGETIKEKPRLSTMINTEGTLNVFEAARLMNIKVVWASSNGVFPITKPNIDYNSKYFDQYVYYPYGMYGAAKLFGENAAEYYSNHYNTNVITLRYCSLLFGAGQKSGVSGDIIRELLIKPALGKKSKVPWGNSTLALLYAEDAARAAILACKLNMKKHTVYNIGGHLAKVKELVDYVKTLLPDSDMQLISEDWNGSSWDSSTLRTEKELGFLPRYSLKQSIKETINIIRKYYRLPSVG